MNQRDPHAELRESLRRTIHATPTEPAEVTEELVQGLIRESCREIEEMLLAKNAAYGNSALDPVRIFSKADPAEQIRVRIDDKLSRLARGHAGGEDVERDITGYLILLRVARKLGYVEEEGQ